MHYEGWRMPIGGCFRGPASGAAIFKLNYEIQDQLSAKNKFSVT